MATKRTPTNVTVSISIPPALADAIAERAAKDDMSAAEVWRRAAAKYLRLPASSISMGTPGRPKKPAAP